ncbi:hypothetical protein SAMN05421848_2114 [Kushneria avicenniae]|uniref:Uncharacterized protein n=1 Tax=Kushneria avicenniae TaxID=402385 RepID=A0A1I1KPZ7_9GAMM|nr:hypothetical protein SAMN05421848_2114 [Kushneria avicenniae]
MPWQLLPAASLLEPWTEQPVTNPFEKTRHERLLCHANHIASSVPLPH